MKRTYTFLEELNHVYHWKNFFRLVFSRNLVLWLELVSKELNYLAAILHVYAGGLILRSKFFFLLLFFKKKREILLHFYTFNHFYIHIFIFKKSKIAQIYYYAPQSAGINVQSAQSESTPRRLTL